MSPHLCAFKAAFRTASRPSSGNAQRSFVKLPMERPMNEETLPHYKKEQFYPVHVGDWFNDRYRVTGKLGFEAYSTSWLCQDLGNQSYVVLKVSTSPRNFPTATDREFNIYKHLTTIESDHPGQSIIRELYDSFEIRDHAGKPVSHLKTDNLMLSLEDNTMLADFADSETMQPSPRKKIDESHTIYQSRPFRRPSKGKSFGLPTLCDFGEARIGNVHESGPFVQPNIYRAPEIIFEMPWGSAVDIWNLGALMWDLFEGHHLFGDIFDEKGNHDPFRHLALMVA
ncbi:hypothetical protein N7492_001070 [Penicillium capsulatum]|uniref:Protein kinase domain-containing protein n=1 Tax=Penicillium capsulatum TaxID=69766 RepID=A0A9W9IT11_9EURO|nr:hypothetical protein N7492_001070 [Penicillium capsulatum]KAJ6129872.1 hypothetical protein N7512_002652 [Penicillium capsulatum]